MNGRFRGMAGILLDSGLAEEQMCHARALHQSAEALLGINNEILDLSKIEAGKLAIECIPFDIQAMVEAAAEVVGSRANEKSIDLMVRIAPQVPRRVTGDPGRIRQILVNLLGNAVKFTSRGHVFLEVECEEPAGESVRLRFTVEDTGIGIPADKLEHIFERFTQVDSSMTRRFGGTGLGLAICKQLVDLMKGSLGVESVPDEGSTFWFTVELGSVLCEERDAARSVLEGLRVLVVDDYLPTRSALVKQMAAWVGECTGFLVLQTLERLRRSKPRGRGASNRQPFHLVLWNQRRQSRRGTSRVDLGAVFSGGRRVFTGVGRIMLASSGLNEPEHTGVVRLVKPIFPSTLLSALVSCSGSSATKREGPASTIGNEAAQAARRAWSVIPNCGFQAHVLVADDNLINQDLARVLLERLGCTSRCRQRWKGGDRELACSAAYDVIFMDCLMPQVDGIEATVEIRRRQLGTRRPTIVALTASAMQGALELCLQAGMDDHISKPVRPQDFSRILSRFLVPPAGSRNAVALPQAESTGTEGVRTMVQTLVEWDKRAFLTCAFRSGWLAYPHADISLIAFGYPHHRPSLRGIRGDSQPGREGVCSRSCSGPSKAAGRNCLRFARNVNPLSIVEKCLISWLKQRRSERVNGESRLSGTTCGTAGLKSPDRLTGR